MPKVPMIFYLINKGGIQIDMVAVTDLLSSVPTYLASLRRDNAYAVRIIVDIALPYSD